MSTSEKAIAEANAVSSKKQAQSFSMPTSKQAHGQLHSGGKQAQAAHLTPTSKHPPVQLYSTSTSKPEPTQLYMTPTSKQANVKQFSTSSTSANRPLIEPLPSVTISTKSSSQTLREFRKSRPGSNPAATEPQKVVTALEAIQQRHGPAMQKILNSGSGLQVTVSKGKSEVRGGGGGGKVKKTDQLADALYHKQAAKSAKESLESRGQNSVKKAKDSREVIRGQSVPKSRSPAASPLRVPKPAISKALSLERKEVEMPTLHIPQKTEKTSSARTNQGHPGLPNGLLWMTSSLIHNSNSNTNMALKECKAGASVIRKEPSLKKLAPLSISDDQFMDRPPKLVAQVAVKQLDDNSFS